MINKALPSFSLADQQGKQWTEADFRGKWTVLYAYPKDRTPGCTIEAHDFTKNLRKFDKLGVQVLGISPDDLESHQNFCTKDGIKYPLLSDTKKVLLKKLGAWKDKSMFGIKYKGMIRSTWIINKKGVIVKEWRKVKVFGHVTEVLSEIKSLIN